MTESWRELEPQTRKLILITSAVTGIAVGGIAGLTWGPEVGVEVGIGTGGALTGFFFGVE